MNRNISYNRPKEDCALYFQKQNMNKKLETFLFVCKTAGVSPF